MPRADTLTRLAAVRKIRTQLIAKGYPRLAVATLLAGAGITAFASSVLLLGLGLEQMGLRYFLAVVVGYVTFLLLIRVWIALNRDAHDLSVPDLFHAVPDLPHGSIETATDASFSGGSSGGGASHSWGEPNVEIADLSDVDADDAWPVVIAVVVAAILAVGAIIALWYVVYTAPILLAEVALDAALVAGMYRKLRREEAGHWLGSAVRRTWKPAAIVAICLTAAGLVMQWAVPSALSVGEVFRRL